MKRPPIPVILVAGFLGSGKTTLLNHLLRACDGRIGVLVNDFGAVNIDAMLVAGQVDAAVTLTNGCVCCAVDREGLDAALDTLLRPSARLDAIVIEASGIAEPKSLIRMVTSSSDPRMRYGGLVYLVDGAMFGRTRTEHPELDGHVTVADLVVINKADLVAADDLADLQELLSTLNPTAAHRCVVDARIDPTMLFDAMPTGDPDARVEQAQQLTLDALLAGSGPQGSDPPVGGASGDHRHTHLHDGFTSVDFTTDDAMDARRLATFLERPPRGCYRIKGVVWFDIAGHRQRFVVHGVGGFVEARREPWSGRKRSTSLVAIGAGMDRDEVMASLCAAVATDASKTDDHGILHIIRHLPNR